MSGPDPHLIREMPVLVLFPHNRCNCRCMMCDIWRLRQVRQITRADLEPHLDSLRRLHVRWVIFSGGEPQLNREFVSLAEVLRAEDIRLTLLTAGLLLEAHADEIAAVVDDVIVSLDGPAEIHDRIRGVPHALERLAQGIEAMRRRRPGIEVGARTTVQKANHAALRRTVQTARHIQANWISFLAADLTSSAFNRVEPWGPARRQQVALDRVELEELEREIESLITDLSPEMQCGFIRENAAKLRRIVENFRSHVELLEPEAPHCNAPWVSAVVEADGSVRPCFFHPAVGNIYQRSLIDIVNGPEAVHFRQELDIERNPICRRCVCSLQLPTNSAILTSVRAS